MTLVLRSSHLKVPVIGGVMEMAFSVASVSISQLKERETGTLQRVPSSPSFHTGDYALTSGGVRRLRCSFMLAYETLSAVTETSCVVP